MSVSCPLLQAVIWPLCNNITHVQQALWRKCVVKSVFVCLSCENGETRTWNWFARFKQRRKRKSRLRKWANQDSPWTAKRTKSRWLSSRDSETRVPGRLWLKKHPKIEWNCSTKRNLSCSSRRRTTSTRSTTSSWTNIGTKSGSSWSSYEKSQTDGRIAAILKVCIRWIFDDKIGRRRKKMNSQPRFRNYKMKFIVWMIRKILKMLNQYAMDNPTSSVTLRFSDLFQILAGCQGLGWMLSRTDKPPDIWDTHGFSGNVFANPTASSSTPFPGKSNPWISTVQSLDLYCVKTGDPRLYVSSSKCVCVCVKLWVHFGSIWVHFGSIWVHFGSILCPFWVHFVSILGPFWV